MKPLLIGLAGFSVAGKSTVVDQCKIHAHGIINGTQSIKTVAETADEMIRTFFGRIS